MSQEREVVCLKLLSHPNIVQLYEVIETPRELCLILESAEGCTMKEYLQERGRLVEDEARCFFQQMVSAVGYCQPRDRSPRS